MLAGNDEIASNTPATPEYLAAFENDIVGYNYPDRWRDRRELMFDIDKAAFPNQPVYTHFHSPRWTCRIGNFRKKETADRIVKQARNKGFDQACVVSEKITVQYR